MKTSSGSTQRRLPLDNLPSDNLPAIVRSLSVSIDKSIAEGSASKSDLSEVAIALLGIITELPTRYSPDALVASARSDRVGIAGWIIDQRLGKDAELDEEEIKMTLNLLCEKKLVRITQTRRLESNAAGEQLWRQMK